MKLIIYIKLILFVSIFLGGNNYAQAIKAPKIEFNPKIYTALKIEGEIKIDGKLDDKFWNITEWSDDFVDIEGKLKPKPYYRTRIKMLWNEKYLYIAGKMQEPHLHATLKQRDTVIFNDNDFEVFIDPDGDTHNYYELEVNQYNTNWDLFLIKPYRDIKKAALNGFDIKRLMTEVNLEGTINNAADLDTGWTIEIAIPWKSISEMDDVEFPPKDGSYFRMNFSRVEWEYDIVNGRYIKKRNRKTGQLLREHNWVWSPQGIVNMHYPELWGFVVFKESDNDFVLPSIEKQKWFLRKVYYVQHKYKRENGSYITSIDELQKYFNEPLNNIEMRSCKNHFEIYYLNSKGERVLFIREDGLIKQY